jgi:hypothetical protein
VTEGKMDGAGMCQGHSFLTRTTDKGQTAGRTPALPGTTRESAVRWIRTADRLGRTANSNYSLA